MLPWFEMPDPAFSRTITVRDTLRHNAGLGPEADLLWLRERFGRPVHRVALDAGSTCPNRDGTKGDAAGEPAANADCQSPAGECRATRSAHVDMARRSPSSGWRTLW